MTALKSALQACEDSVPIGAPIGTLEPPNRLCREDHSCDSPLPLSFPYCIGYHASDRLPSHTSSQIPQSKSLQRCKPIDSISTQVLIR